jgi:hypothetical protein
MPEWLRKLLGIKKQPEVFGECPKGGEPVTSEKSDHCIRCVGGKPPKERDK